AGRRALRDTDATGGATELGEGADADAIERAVGQGGLFGAATVLIDFDEAFEGQAGVAPRNEAMKRLADAPDDVVVIAIDAKATPARQKRWQELGEHRHLPTPRFGALQRWIADELAAHGVRFRAGVPARQADLFGEDLPGQTSEIANLAVLDEELSDERVSALVNRPASRDAFDMIEALAVGDGATAVRVARQLMEAGEPAPRVLGALAWQFGLVAGAVALVEREGREPSPAVAAKALGAAPFAAKKALAVARRLDEARLERAYAILLDAERAVKTGETDPGWAVTSAAMALAEHFATARP
ncbi:MAG: hypothetical protein WD336_07940, partial [Trueperaceae bacterium]